MEDIIKKSDAIEAIDETPFIRRPILKHYLKAKINKIPSAEKQGEWERIPYSFAGGFRCSCCGIKSRDNYWNFCPNCGCRMRKGADDDSR